MAITVEFDEIRDCADNFRENGDELRDIINEAENMLNELVGGGFEGAAADAFVAKFEELKPGLEDAASLFDEIGDALDTTADNFEELDSDMASSING